MLTIDCLDILNLKRRRTYGIIQSKLFNQRRTMMRNLVLFGFLIKMTSAISLVEILFKSNIKDARFQAQCLDVETPEERTRCVSICRELEARPQDGDLCSLSSVCTGGCLVACEARTASSIGVKITEARMETCDLSWDLASDP